jgi:hypothetical protein
MSYQEITPINVNASTGVFKKINKDLPKQVKIATSDL